VAELEAFGFGGHAEELGELAVVHGVVSLGCSLVVVVRSGICGTMAFGGEEAAEFVEGGVFPGVGGGRGEAEFGGEASVGFAVGDGADDPAFFLGELSR
jgi:hypothetical protein